MNYADFLPIRLLTTIPLEVSKFPVLAVRLPETIEPTCRANSREVGINSEPATEDFAGVVALRAALFLDAIDMLLI